MTAVADFTAIWDYEAQPKEWVPGYDSDDEPWCPLCATPPHTMNKHERDRYGYAVMVERCACGLVYLNPRMTAEAYAEFYRTGAYRALVAEWERSEGRTPPTDETLRASQKLYAVALVTWLRHRLKGPGTLLDIGGSTGVVARTLASVFNLQPTVLDPAAGELPADIEAIPLQVEDFEPNGRTWDVVTMCQTVDHLLDISGTLRKVLGLLSEGGLFYVDIVDHTQVGRIKIDHPFYLTPRVMERFLRQNGFGIVACQRAEDPRHFRFLCRRKA